MNQLSINNLNIMIKPASSSCNLRCKYCFYLDEAKNRSKENYGIMSTATLENLVKNAFALANKSVSFLFQGGEPSLAGLEFFEKFHHYVNQYNTNNIDLHFAIQTNGILLNKAWIEFFRKHNYLVGISLDGPKECHDFFRLDKNGRGTFDRVMESIKLLQNEKIPTNILTVVNNNNSDKAREIYNFFKENDLYYLQFIPAINPINEDKDLVYGLESIKYGYFLDELFEAWYEDIIIGDFRSIRYFENLLMIMPGGEAEACDMVGHCSVTSVIEADGSVYPCDFYCLDQEILGDINQSSFSDLLLSKKTKSFIEKSFTYSKKCETCTYYRICRGGCRRYKNSSLENELCQGFYYFFEKNYSKLLELANFIKNKKAYH